MSVIYIYELDQNEILKNSEFFSSFLHQSLFSFLLSFFFFMKKLNDCIMSSFGWTVTGITILLFEHLSCLSTFHHYKQKLNIKINDQQYYFLYRCVNMPESILTVLCNWYSTLLMNQDLQIPWNKKNMLKIILLFSEIFWIPILMTKICRLSCVQGNKVVEHWQLKKHKSSTNYSKILAILELKHLRTKVNTSLDFISWSEILVPICQSADS